MLLVMLVAWLAAACGEEAGRDIGRAEESPAHGEATAPEPAGVAYVLASRRGVDLVAADGDTTKVSDQPAAAAFGVRGDLVVFQRSGPPEDPFLSGADRPVALWSHGEVSELPTDPSATRVRLLDAGLVDGQPAAVVAEEFGDNPENTHDQLTLIDLRDLSRTIGVPQQRSWESSYAAARIMPDADIVAFRQQSVVTKLVRWPLGAQEPTWTVEVAVDRAVELVVVDGRVFVVEPSFDSGRDFAPVLTVTPHDPSTGEPGAAARTDVSDPDGSLDTGLFCGDWSSPDELACARSGGAPVVVSLDEGSFEELPGAPGAIPTLVREQ